MREESESACITLKSRYPNSHYSQLLKEECGGANNVALDLIVLPLDSVYQNGGLHAKKFALLCALRLPELALKEWRAASSELSASQSMAWWKAQVYYWSGDRYNAWLAVRASLSKYVLSSGSRPQDFYRITYPLDYDPFILKRANDYDLDPYFVFALICQESHYEETIESGAGAIGLMQLMPETARREAKKMGLTFEKNDLYSAETNLNLGISHLAELFEEFHHDSVLVLAAYNAGKSAAQAWFEEFGDRPRDEFIELIPYRETRLFIKNIMEHQAAYRRIYPNLLSESIHEASSETETPK
jgi:soluble lytic murein transglycosylase